MKRAKHSKILAIVLAITMVMTSLIPTVVFAAGESAMSGTCGAEGNENNVSWELTQNNEDSANPTYTLTISGTGAMADYGYNDITRPWHTQRETITEIRFNEQITNVGAWAFFGCKYVTKVTLTESIEKIGPSAFQGLTNLTGTFHIGKNVSSFGQDALYSTSIDQYTIDSTNITYKVVDDILYSADGKTIISCPQKKAGQFNTAWLEGVENIADSAFRNCKDLTGTLEIPDSVTSIGALAFQTCQKLTGDLTIPDSLKGEIKEWTFGNCGFDGKLKIGSGITSIGNNAFQGCKFDELELGNVISIGDAAFSQCSLLSGTLFIPESVTDIGKEAFKNCSLLTGALTIPDTVAGEIGDNTFYGCGFTSIHIGNGITAIGNNAFANCKDAISLKLGNNITTIASNAFQGDISLTGDLIIPDSVQGELGNVFKDCGFDGKLKIGNGITTIGERAFQNSKITSLEIGENVSTIGTYAFYESSLKGDLVIPDSVTTIQNGAFYGCTDLAGNLTLSKNLTSVGVQAFYMCKFTGPIVVPNGVIEIPTSAFYGMKPVCYVIPNSVTTFGNTSLDGTSGTRIIYLDNTEQLNKLTSKELGNMSSPRAVTNGGIFAPNTVFTTGTLATPIKDGYKFEGWYENADLTGTEITTPATGKAYYAKWTNDSANDYLVTESLDFGTTKYGQPVDGKTITASLNIAGTATIKSAVSSNPELFVVSGIDGGNTVTVTPKEKIPAGKYTETIYVTTGNDYVYFVPVTFTVIKNDSEVEDNNSTATATYGEKLTLSVNIAPTAFKTRKLQADSNEVHFYYGDTLLGKTYVSYIGDNGTATYEYDTTRGIIPTGSSQKVTAVYGGSSNLEGNSTELTVMIDKADQSISYETTTVEKHINAGAFTSELTKTTVDGEITYTSSTPSVATVNETTGEVTIVGAGTVTITATAAETSNYHSATAAYTLTVTDHSFTNYVYNNDATYFADGTETAVCEADGCEETHTRTAQGSMLMDTTAPTGEIKVKENSWKSFVNKITFGIFCKDKYDVTITAEDKETGIKSIEYLLSDTAISEDDIASADGWKTYSAFSLENEGKYIIYAKITDQKDNVTYISSNGLVIDKTAPAVSGIEDGKTYCSAVEVTVSDEYLDGVTVNGEDATITDGKFTVEPKDGEQTIVVTDKAGNEVSYTITVNDGHTFTNYVSNNDATCTQDGTETAVCDNGCGEKDTRTDVDSHLGHDLGEWETVTSPDCTNKGSQKRECSRCDYVEIKDIDPNGHEWEDDFTVDKEATCTTDGSQSIHCKNCEAVKDSTVIPATDHSYDDSWKSDANNHWKECINCGDKAETATHDFEWIIDKEATETEKGSKHEECSVCGYKKDAVEIPAAGKPGDNTTGGDNENPSKPSDPDAEAPQTGDNSNLWIWIVLMAVSAAGTGITLVVSKKRNCCGDR